MCGSALSGKKENKNRYIAKKKKLENEDAEELYQGNDFSALRDL